MENLLRVANHRRMRKQLCLIFKGIGNIVKKSANARAKAESMYHRFNKRLLAGVIEEWKLICTRESQKQADLRRCIARKRVTQQWFMDW